MKRVFFKYFFVSLWFFIVLTFILTENALLADRSRYSSRLGPRTDIRYANQSNREREAETEGGERDRERLSVEPCKRKVGGRTTFGESQHNSL